MDNQERNREALIEHIAEQDRIIRRRNEQIAGQAHNAREDQRVIDEQDARNDSLAADLAATVNKVDRAESERDEYRAMHSEQMKTIARLQENPRTLTADDYQRGEMAALAAFAGPKLSIPINALVRAIVNEVLTPPPSRPEGAEELQALIRQAEAEGEGADNEALANYLAARLIHPTVKEQS